jgi:hypothetical protein
MNHFRKLVSLFAFSLLILGVPTLASAQWRDRDDDYYRNNRNYNRNLKATIKNLKNHSKDFAKKVERELDRRWDDRRWDDRRWDDRRYNQRLVELSRELRDAAEDLDRRYDNRNYDRSSYEARRVLQLGEQLEREIYRSRYSSVLGNEWSKIRQNLNILADAYGYKYQNNRNDRRYGDWRNRFPFPF